MAVTITSTADKEVAVILAEANKNSEIMKGEGDGQRNKIFADAFGRDPEFFYIVLVKAWIPVMYLPMIKLWISWVPS